MANFRDIEIGDSTSPLVIQPRADREPDINETAESLQERTKTEIVNLAAERFGVDLSIRVKKDLLIESFLTYQGLHND